MNLLLLQHAPYLGAFGGAPKANRALLEILAARGHRCTVVAPAARTTVLSGALEVCSLAAVEVRSVREPLNVRRFAREAIAERKPDRIVVSSEDPGQLLLALAIEACRTSGGVVHLTHTLANVPFGPWSLLPSAAGVELLRQAGALVVVSRFAQSYFRSWADLDSVVFYPPAYGAGPFEQHGRFECGSVLMLNPCSFKGIGIFLELARTLPHFPFAAVPTWGTSAADLEALAGCPNISLLNPDENIDLILRQARVVVVPSLLEETFGLIAVEAMLRGIPVLASSIGGLAEAMLGARYSLPVHPIKLRPETVCAATGWPEIEVPAQDLAPWHAALRSLLTDPDHYAEIAREGRAAATGFVAALSVTSFEQLLAAAGAAPPTGASTSSSQIPAPAAQASSSRPTAT